MSKSKKVLKLLIAIIILIFALTNLAYAETSAYTEIANTTDTDNTSLGSTSENAKNSDLYIYNDKVSIDDVVSGNVYIIGNDVTINNVIDGNVFILADKVTITDKAYIYSDLYVCAKTLDVSGYIYDLYSASNELTIEKSGYIIRDLHAGCDTINFNGYVRRNASIGCTTFNADTSSAKIGGDLNCTSKNEISVNTSFVSGKVNYTKEKSETKSAVSASSSVFFASASFIYALVLVLIIVLAMPKVADKNKELISTKFWPILGLGLLGLILVPIISLILLITVFGIWASLALLCVYFLILSATTAIVGVAFGKLFCDKMNKSSNGMVILMSMIVVLALILLEKVPFIGGIVSFLQTLIGFGIIVYSIFHCTKKSDNTKKDIEVSPTESSKAEETK